MKYLLILLMWFGVAQAQTAPAITAHWDVVTAMSDGTPIPAGKLVSYNLYGGHSASGPWTLAINTTALSVVRSGVSVGIDCYQLTSMIGSTESAPTTSICVTITGGLPPPVSTTPATPTGFSVLQTQ